MEQTTTNSANSAPKFSNNTLTIFLAGTVISAISAITLLRRANNFDNTTYDAIKNNPAIIAIEKQREPYENHLALLQRRENDLIEATFKPDIKSAIEILGFGILGLSLMGIAVATRIKEINTDKKKV